MEDPIYLYLVGTAGAGKSTMTKAMSDWMLSKGYDPVILNLDPGSLHLPYTPAVDIREWLILQDVMDEYELGPNGAQVACADMLALHIGEVADIMQGFDSDYVIVDTPGQIELFAFRSASRVVIEALSPEGAALACLFDPMLSIAPSGFVSSLMLYSTVQFRLQLPAINVLAKSDLLEDGQLDAVMEWSTEPDRLLDAARGEAGAAVGSMLSVEFFKSLENIGAFTALTPVSAKAAYGMEDIYNMAQQMFMGGEDLE